MAEQVRVGIIGAAGLSAGKLMEILARHPDVTIVSAVSESSPGAPVHSVHPQLHGVLNLQFEAFDAAKLADCDVVFSAKRAGETFPFIEKILGGRAVFIDLSGDYRLKSAELYEQWYGIRHQHPSLLEQAVYGLPELHREKIRGARLIANPGCYTTTTILACAPLVAAGYGVGEPVMIDAISGVSGAGRNTKAENMFLAVADNVRAYRIGNHQHTPEIEQELCAAAKDACGVRLLFVPHVGPYKVGIMATCYLRVPEPMEDPTRESLQALLAKAYEGEPFVRVREAGDLPQIEHVAGTNFCDIGVEYDPRTRTVVLVSVTDNLIKGAAGQAVQNMNIVFGFDERTALI